MSARQQLVDLIESALEAAEADPMPEVTGFAASLDATTLRVLVMPEEIVPTPAAPRGARTYTFSVLAVARLTVPTLEAEEELDDLVADVLDALDWVGKDLGVTWSSARRATYEDKAPAYLITATAPLVNSEAATDPEA